MRPYGSWRVGLVLLVMPAGGRVLADSIPPVGTKAVRVITVIEVAEDLGEYHFFRVTAHVPVDNSRGRDRTTVGPRGTTADRAAEPTRWVVSDLDVGPGRSVRVPDASDYQTYVHAVPRGVVEQFPDHESMLAALHARKVPGADWHLCARSDRVSATDPRTEVVERFRIERTADGKGVTFSRLKGGPNHDGRTDEAAVRWAVAGVAAAVATGAFGLWLTGRWRRGRAPGSGPDPAGSAT